MLATMEVFQVLRLLHTFRRLESAGLYNYNPFYCSQWCGLWIRIISASRIRIAKTEPKSWQIYIKIEINYQNIIFLKVEITPFFNAHKEELYTKHNKYFFGRIRIFYEASQGSGSISSWYGSTSLAVPKRFKTSNGLHSELNMFRIFPYRGKSIKSMISSDQTKICQNVKPRWDWAKDGLYRQSLDWSL